MELAFSPIRVAAGLGGGSLGRARSARPAEAGPVVVMHVMMRGPRHGARPIAEAGLSRQPFQIPLIPAKAGTQDK